MSDRAHRRFPTFARSLNKAAVVGSALACLLLVCLHALLGDLAACPSGEPAALGAPRTLTLADGQVLSGTVVGDEILIPGGATVLAEEDLLLSARSTLSIRGTLRATDRAGTDSVSDGVRLVLESGGVMLIDGEVLGGRGGCVVADGALASLGLAGGRGSDITLSAPLIEVSGHVVAGRGGRSGAHTKGPAGGDVLVEGICVKGDGARGTQLHGGAGGEAGATVDPTVAAGPGGDGGWVHRSRHPRESEDQTSAVRPWSALPEASALIPECEPGSAGQAGADSCGGQGADGAAGANGSSASPAGGTGGVGGAGGGTDAAPITGGTGGTGGAGEGCCSPPQDGKDGGAGGTGGKGSGGKGGRGGRGGDGFWDPDRQAYTGPNGHGGNGGPGGEGRGGRGGDGGRGSDGDPPGSGGPGGAGGVSAGGAGGDGGRPGHRGNPMNGQPGDAGPPGGAIAHLGPGSEGADGNPCD